MEKVERGGEGRRGGEGADGSRGGYGDGVYRGLMGVTRDAE